MADMAEPLSISINGATVRVRAGTTVAAAMLSVGAASRLSVTGALRAPLCGMGICLECRAVIDGVSHRRSCQILCAEAMAVETEG